MFLLYTACSLTDPVCRKLRRQFRLPNANKIKLNPPAGEAAVDALWISSLHPASVSLRARTVSETVQERRHVRGLQYVSLRRRIYWERL